MTRDPSFHMNHFIQSSGFHRIQNDSAFIRAESSVNLFVQKAPVNGSAQSLNPCFDAWFRARGAASCQGLRRHKFSQIAAIITLESASYLSREE